MGTTPAMDLALAAPVVVDFVCVEALLPAPVGALRLLIGASQITWAVPDIFTGVTTPRTFVGEDPGFGTIAGLESMSEGIGTFSPRCRFVIYPPTHAAAANLNHPTMQGAHIRVWYGCVNLDTGVVVPDPLLKFWGQLDQPRFVGSVPGGSVRAVAYDAASALELLMTGDEAQRLNHAQHVRMFPGELGLQYVSEAAVQLPWGQDAARVRLVAADADTYTPGGGGGMGGGGTGGGGTGGGTSGGSGGFGWLFGGGGRPTWPGDTQSV